MGARAIHRAESTTISCDLVPAHARHAILLKLGRPESVFVPHVTHDERRSTTPAGAFHAGR